MAKVQVVSNSGPLIALSSIQQLDILKLLFGSIIIPEAVYADYVILDERLARCRAHLLGLTVIGTFGILLMAQKDGHIHTIAGLLDALEQNAFRMSPEVKAQILRKAGET